MTGRENTYQAGWGSRRYISRERVMAKEPVYLSNRPLRV